MNKTNLLRALTLLCLARFAFPQSSSPASTPYVLGPDDQVVIRALDAEEIGATPVRIDSRGFINLPTVGRIKAAGMTSEELEAEIESRLKKYINKPDVSVYIAEMRTQPISVIGAVQTPGVQRMQGQKTLFEALSAAGGLRPDAGYHPHPFHPRHRRQLGPLGIFSLNDIEIGGIDRRRLHADQHLARARLRDIVLHNAKNLLRRAKLLEHDRFGFFHRRMACIRLI